MNEVKIKIPWAKVGLLIGKFIQAAKGGINKEEAEDLLGELAELAIIITKQL
jgi:hypothetical protein